jgi:mannosyl-oligosaccharide alpha-1,3-glucosidase
MLWMDIDHTNELRYFEFDPDTFKPDDIATINAEVEKASKRLVVIADPHIKHDEHYPVFLEGRLRQSIDPKEKVFV